MPVVQKTIGPNQGRTGPAGQVRHLRQKTVDRELAMPWPLHFKSAWSAIRWADGYLNRPKVHSALRGLVLKTPGVVHASGEWTAEDYESLAHRISATLAEFASVQASCYRHVWGYNTHTMDIIDTAAHEVWQGPGSGCVAKLKTIAQCRSLASLVLEDVKRRERYSTKVPAKYMARVMRMPRQRWYEQWGDERAALTALYFEWLKNIDRRFAAKLQMMKIL